MRKWPEESLRRFEEMAAKRQERFEAYAGSLPPPSRWAPADWAPKSASGKAEYAKGYERLAKEPLLFAFGWETRGRLVDVELAGAAAVCEELRIEADEAPLSLLGAPASSLWRLADRERWRSFCAQAASLSPERLRAALERFAAPLTTGFYDAPARALRGPREHGALSSHARIEPSYSGGFLLAFAVQINPGRLLDEAPLARGAPEFEDRLAAAKAEMAAELAAAAQSLARELCGASALPSVERRGRSVASIFNYSWGESSEQRELAGELCQSAWEAGEIERGLGDASPSPARPRSRL